MKVPPKGSKGREEMKVPPKGSKGREEMKVPLRGNKEEKIDQGGVRNVALYDSSLVREREIVTTGGDNNL